MVNPTPLLRLSTIGIKPSTKASSIPCVEVAMPAMDTTMMLEFVTQDAETTIVASCFGTIAPESEPKSTVACAVLTEDPPVPPGLLITLILALCVPDRDRDGYGV